MYMAAECRLTFSCAYTFASVWRLGKAPPGWKIVLIKRLSKGSGDPLDCNQSRGSSLINTEGKAYGMVILNRVRTYLEAQLLDAQQGFRQQRGTPDALPIQPTAHDGACPAI